MIRRYFRQEFVGRLPRDITFRFHGRVRFEWLSQGGLGTPGRRESEVDVGEGVTESEENEGSVVTTERGTGSLERKFDNSLLRLLQAEESVREVTWRKSCWERDVRDEG